MKTKATPGARIVLGLTFFVFGLNGFLSFIPSPPMSGPPASFVGSLIATGYLFPLLRSTEVDRTELAASAARRRDADTCQKPQDSEVSS